MPGSQTCSPNSHRKPHRNVLRVFDVSSEKQCDSKSYFAFVVETFSELFVYTEIPRSRNSCVTTLSVTVSSWQSSQRAYEPWAWIPENSSTRNPNIFLIALHFLTNIKYMYSRFDETFCGNSVNNFDCRAFSRHVNKGKTHKITISSNSSGPCGKLCSTKLGVQELEVDNIVFD